MGADWLMLGPTGPRRLRLAVEYLCQIRGGICFLVDLDPRWVNKLIARGALQELELYKAHVIDQALTILRANDNVKCMFTTPKLLEAICEKISLKKAGISGIFCGGNRDGRAVQPFRQGGADSRNRLRADVWKYVDGTGVFKTPTNPRTITPLPIIRPSRGP